MPDVPRDMLIVESVQLKPVEGEIPADNVTTPVKPLTVLTVMVELPGAPAFVATPVWSAATVKSRMFTVTVAVCERLVVAPVRVTVYPPAIVPVQLNVEAWGVPKVTL